MNTIIAANWKMNKTTAEAKAFAETFTGLLAKKGVPGGRSCMIFPSALSLDVLNSALAASPVVLGAQNFYPAESGAFTGELSLAQLSDVGAKWVLIGHSERRHILNEDFDCVARKTAFAFEKGLGIMLCVGETLAEREAGSLRTVLTGQIETALRGLSVGASDHARLAVAYEPVWAIGTGKVATEKEIAEAHGMVKEILASFSPSLDDLPVLYGGSVKPANATGILAIPNVNGLLIGGASLAADSFYQILQA
ncbi:MAG: triose-phosphate isomerase [Desulfovibrio sp.]|nr:triose-phosphate isomerase [Desulfovibrio sp.]